MSTVKQITPQNNNGTIRLRFTLQGKRYTLNPVLGGRFDNPVDLAAANQIATQIQLDIATGHFDDTLQRYLPQPPEQTPKKSSLLEIWDAWVDSLDLAPHTKADHYQAIRRQMVKNLPPVSDRRSLSNVDWFLQSKVIPCDLQQALRLP